MPAPSDSILPRSVPSLGLWHNLKRYIIIISHLVSIKISFFAMSISIAVNCGGVSSVCLVVILLFAAIHLNEASLAELRRYFPCDALTGGNRKEGALKGEASPMKGGKTG